MSVYDRSMFRRPRPTAQGAGDAAAQALMGEVENRMVNETKSGIASAQNYEQVMNAMRGDEQSVKERRKELGGIVGMKDANKTPESVLTLVQPVVQMREAQGAVDQGIGQMAQKAMDTPVEGAMAGGIMQPVKMQAGGAASLKKLYEQNLPVIQDIYGDQSEELRKQALGQFLLGGAAPVGLAIAQGTPVAEALMQLGPYAAQLGAGVQKQKSATQAAQKQAALQMAQSELAAQREAAAKAKELKFPSPGSGIVDAKGNLIGTVPFKPETDRVSVFKLDPTNPMGFVSQDIKKDQPTPEGFSRSKPDIGSYSVMLDRATGKLTKGTDLFFSQQQPGKFTQPLPETLIDAFDATGKKVKIPYASYQQNIADYSLEDPKDTTTIYPLNNISMGDTVLPAGQSVTVSKSFAANLPEGSYSTEAPVDKLSKAKVVYKRGANGIEAKVAYDADTYQDLIDNQGFTPNTPEKFQFVRMVKLEDGKPVVKTATNFNEQNKFIADGYRPYTVDIQKLGNKVLSISPVGTKVVYENLEADPATLFNADGKPKVVGNKAEALAARRAGFHFTSKPETKGITRSLANALLVDYADEIANGTATPEQIREFQTSVSVVRDTPRVVTGEGGESMVTVGGTVPPFVVEAVRRAKERDPEFNDMGLLDVPVAEVAQEQDYEGIIDPNINYAESIGPQSKFGRIIGNSVDFIKSLAGADYDPTNKASFEGANDLHYLNIITVTRGLNAIGGKDTEGLRARIESLQVDPYSAGLTKTKLKSSVDNMLSFLKDNKVKLEGQKREAPTPQLKAKKTADIDEMDYLISQYEILQRNLTSQAGAFGSGPVDPRQAPSLSKPQ